MLANDLLDQIIGRVTLVSDISGLFGMGATQKFAQIFFRLDNDLRGKRRKDPKNAYVTGIFGRRYISNCFILGRVWPDNFSVEITRDSNTLDTPKEWR
ncbi:MAG: hypothetical protein WCC81_05900 [Pseudolabrys sp.]